MLRGLNVKESMSRCFDDFLSALNHWEIEKATKTIKEYGEFIEKLPTNKEKTIENALSELASDKVPKEDKNVWASVAFYHLAKDLPFKCSTSLKREHVTWIKNTLKAILHSSDVDSEFGRIFSTLMGVNNPINSIEINDSETLTNIKTLFSSLSEMSEEKADAKEREILSKLKLATKFLDEAGKFGTKREIPKTKEFDDLIKTINDLSGDKIYLEEKPTKYIILTLHPLSAKLLVYIFNNPFQM